MFLVCFVHWLTLENIVYAKLWNGKIIFDFCTQIYVKALPCLCKSKVFLYDTFLNNVCEILTKLYGPYDILSNQKGNKQNKQERRVF